MIPECTSEEQLVSSSDAYGSTSTHQHKGLGLGLSLRRYRVDPLPHEPNQTSDTTETLSRHSEGQVSSQQVCSDSLTDPDADNAGFT